MKITLVISSQITKVQLLQKINFAKCDLTPKMTPHLLYISLINSEGGFVDFRVLTADEREALYNEVWSEPMTTCVFRSKKATLSEQTGRPFGVK